MKVRALLGLWLILAFAGGCFAREAVVRLVVLPPIEGRLYGTDSSTPGWEQVAVRVKGFRAEDPHSLVVAGPRFFGPEEVSNSSGQAPFQRDFLALSPDGWLPAGDDHERASGLSEQVKRLGVNHPQVAEGVRPGWFFKWVNGVKVAVVGVSDEAGWAVEPHAGGLTVRRAVDGERGLKAVLPAIRKEQPDVWILLADASEKRVRHWVKTFPEFDAAVALRSKAPIEEGRIGARLLVAPDRAGRWMAECRLVFDTVQRQVVRSGGHLVDLRRLPVSKGQENPVAVADEPDLAEQRGLAGADILWASAGSDGNRGGGSRWVGALTRTEMREMVARWQEVGLLATIRMEGLDDAAWQQGTLRLASGKALHATKRYKVAVDEALLVPLGESADRPGVGVLQEPRARWARLGTDKRGTVHR